jgi:hypothetical protein
VINDELFDKHFCIFKNKRLKITLACFNYFSKGVIASIRRSLISCLTIHLASAEVVFESLPAKIVGARLLIVIQSTI